jgi:hypothetical protein
MHTRSVDDRTGRQQRNTLLALVTYRDTSLRYLYHVNVVRKLGTVFTVTSRDQFNALVQKSLLTLLLPKVAFESLDLPWRSNYV